MGCCECVHSEREKMFSILSPEEAHEKTEVKKISTCKESSDTHKTFESMGGVKGKNVCSKSGDGGNEVKEADTLKNDSFLNRKSAELGHEGTDEVRIMGLPEYSSNSSLASWKPTKNMIKE
jgi:hypothetical protein